MAKDPAFLFYPGDWLGGTLGMSLEMKGAYIELLILQFNTGGFTEDEAKHTLNVRFDYAWPTLKRKFIFNGEVYMNKRLSDEIEKRSKFIESRRLSGLSPKKRKAYAKHTLKRGENENENENINIDFNVFWDLYDKKVGDKQKCEKKWNSLKPEERQKIIDTLPAFKASIKDKQFQPHPSSYLNQKRWNDEIQKPRKDSGMVY